MRACPSGVSREPAKQRLMTSSIILVDTDAPGDAPSKVEMERSSVVITSVPK